jgi:HAD superfamily hydrolase (TIGR01509 family)
MLKAIIWDVDGTLAETERDGHRVAFNLAFEALGLPWRWDEARYGELLRVTGGRERILHDMASRADAPALGDERERLARALHQRKNALYGEILRQRGIPLREGVDGLMAQCRAEGVRMAVATTTSRGNVDELLTLHMGARWRERFDAVVCGEDVQHKKPDPEVYQRCLALLGVGALDAVALEDSPGGVAAARGADVPVIVTRSHYFSDAPIDGAVAIGPGLHRRDGWRPALPGAEGGGAVGLADIRHWHAQMQLVAHFP